MSCHFIRKGLISFGTVDDLNVFNLVPRINGRFVDWNLLRSINVAETSQSSTTSSSSTGNDGNVLNDANDTRTNFER